VPGTKSQNIFLKPLLLILGRHHNQDGQRSLSSLSKNWTKYSPFCSAVSGSSSKMLTVKYLWISNDLVQAMPLENGDLYVITSVCLTRLKMCLHESFLSCSYPFFFLSSPLPALVGNNRVYRRWGMLVGNNQLTSPPANPLYITHSVITYRTGNGPALSPTLCIGDWYWSFVS